MFRIYRGQKIVAEGDSPLTITGLESGKRTNKGTYKVTRVVDGKESEKVDLPGFTTLVEEEGA